MVCSRAAMSGHVATVLVCAATGWLELMAVHPAGGPACFATRTMRTDRQEISLAPCGQTWTVHQFTRARCFDGCTAVTAGARRCGGGFDRGEFLCGKRRGS